IDDAPSAVRYPRGEGVGVALPAQGVPLEIGKGRILREGERVALLSLGTRLAECLKAAEQLEAQGISTTVADARFAKPLDETLIRDLFKRHELVVTVEEGAIGGFGAHVLCFAAKEGLLTSAHRALPLYLPDTFIEHGNPHAMYDEAGLNAAQILSSVLAQLGDKKPALVKKVK
ncbi:MAG: 1-deoxy-D-xylulose-5-phosphate synthase, partial [Alphaproteobacteria bacterium]|nr:1-deoxy-D-xylulose-5-phosphate synthase [Alphaproteobacteria bacterium]